MNLTTARRATRTLVLLTMLLAACSSGDGRSDGVEQSVSSATISSTKTTTFVSGSPSGPEGLALAAYRGMWSDFVVAARTSDYRSKTLGPHVTGDALAMIVQSLARDKKAGGSTAGCGARSCAGCVGVIWTPGGSGRRSTGDDGGSDRGGPAGRVRGCLDGVAELPGRRPCGVARHQPSRAGRDALRRGSVRPVRHGRAPGRHRRAADAARGCRRGRPSGWTVPRSR
jgi:hypothetical protein